MKPKRIKSNKILITLPFWNGDRDSAMLLARLISDLEPKQCEFADFLFVSRFDSEHDPATIKHVARKFSVYTHVSGRREVGWPSGCSGLFFGAMEFFYGRIKAETIPWYKAILICEADTVPMTRGWIELLSREWDRLSKIKRTCVAGAMVGGSVFGKQHVNGGCVMLSGDLKFLAWLSRAAASFSAIAGWDWALADEFKAWGWADIPGMKSYWQRDTMGQAEAERLTAEGIILLHGIKDDSLLKYVRRSLV